MNDPGPATTIRDLLSGDGRGPALVTVGGDVLDRGSLARELDRLCDRLAAVGIAPNDRVAVVLPNGPEMALSLLAVMSLACAAPLNPKYRTEEFAFYLGDLKPVAVLTLQGAYPALMQAAGDVLQLHVKGGGLDIDLVADRPPRAAAGVRAWPSADDQALVLHTSGTTSRPKIVPLRQRHLCASARSIATSLELDASDRSLTVMPLFHIHGIMAGLLAPLSAGAAVVATPGFDAFKFGRWLEDLRPTYYSAVPTMHHLVLARARGGGGSSLRFVRSSSSALPRALFEDLRQLFGVPVIESYGMTEASHQMTANPLPPGVARPGSVGLPAGVEVAILDEDGRLLGPRETGEVAVRGPSVIEGYENNPEANATAFVDGWFRTGDEGYLDGDGYLHLTGRLKEQINRAGEKISPLEVEDVLLGHPAVDEAVVFAVHDDRLGEEVAAAVVLGGEPAPTEADLRAYLGERLAAFKVPRTMLLVEEIPKGPTGKLQRIGMAERLGLE